MLQSRSCRFILPLSLLLPALLPAQGTRITGRVLSATTGRAIPGASVHLVGATQAAMVSDSGCYVIQINRPKSSDTLAQIQAIRTGYQIGTRLVRLLPDSQVVDFLLQPDGQGTTTPPLTRTGDNPCSPNRAGQILDKSFVAQLPETRINTMVTGAPGVVAGRGGGGGGGRGGLPTPVRGSRYTADGVYVDGIPVDRSNPLPPRCALPGNCPEFNTEAYDRITDNPFLSSAANPLSTFSIDVDRASFANVRRFIDMGQKPPKDAVRIEELLNYFAYDYPAPAATESTPFSISTEVTPAPWNPTHRLVRIALQGRRIDRAKLPPANLVFLIDVSGSMAVANKLPLVKTAMGMLLDQLREEDQVAIVTYAGNTALVLESTSAADKRRIRDAITRLTASGGTAGGAGLRLAYNVARQHFIRGGNNRIILATDGDFNLGISSDAEMERLIEEERTGGSFLTVLGFGMGNLKDSKLERLADKGNGNYAYINSSEEAEKTLVREMSGTLFTIAKDVKLQVEFNPGKVQGYRLIGYENRMLKTEDFTDDRKDAGDMGAGHSVTALYEIVPVGVKSAYPLGGRDSLRYQVPAIPSPAASGAELMMIKVRYKQPDSDASVLLTEAVVERGVRQTVDFRFATAVAEFGMLLRDSEYRGKASLDDVLLLARSSLGRDPTGDRGEFVRMVVAYQKLNIPAETPPIRRGGGVRP